jgi:hypothetical protein
MIGEPEQRLVGERIINHPGYLAVLRRALPHFQGGHWGLSVRLRFVPNAAVLGQVGKPFIILRWGKNNAGWDPKVYEARAQLWRETAAELPPGNARDAYLALAEGYDIKSANWGGVGASSLRPFHR